MTNINNEEQCKGCYTYGDNAVPCTVNGLNSFPCPCGTCLVKMVCKIGCDELEDYTNYRGKYEI